MIAIQQREGTVSIDWRIRRGAKCPDERRGRVEGGVETRPARHLPPAVYVGRMALAIGFRTEKVGVERSEVQNLVVAVEKREC